MSAYSTKQEDVMTVKTVGEMVKGHTFDAMATDWDNDTRCQSFSEGTSDAPQVCGRPYDEHSLRPPMPKTTMDQRVPMPLDKFGFAQHRAGCATMCEVLGSCTCGMLDFNMSRIVWLMESQLAKAQEMAGWATDGIPPESMPSTEFRTSYAGIEGPTDVTVNGRVIGRWTPMLWPYEAQTNSPITP